jgi:hypothetical protein
MSAHTHAEHHIALEGLTDFANLYHAAHDQKLVKDYLTMRLRAWAETQPEVKARGAVLEVTR